MCSRVLRTVYYASSLIGGSIKRCFCLTSVCLSVAYIGRNSWTERPRKTKIGTEVAHVSRDSDTTFKDKRSKGQGHQAALVGCSSHWIIYMDDTAVSTPPPRASRSLSIMNIHGARRAGRRRRKACMGWSWAAACGVQGRGHIAQHPAQPVTSCLLLFRIKSDDIFSTFQPTKSSTVTEKTRVGIVSFL